MNARFLTAQDVEHIRQIMQAHGLSAFGASVRLWGRGKSTIGIHGEVCSQELACLLAIHRYLDPPDESNKRPPVAVDGLASSTSLQA